MSTNAVDPTKINAERIRSARFATTFRGYDTSEVRAHLDQVADAYEALLVSESLLRDEVRRATSITTDTATASPRGAVAGAPADTRESPLDVEASAAATLPLMPAEIEALRSAAKVEAEATLAAARNEAHAIVSKANDEAARIILRARAESRGRPSGEAMAVVEAAMSETTDPDLVREQAKLMISEARAVRERILTDLAKRRRVAHVQLEQMRVAREKLVESLREARRLVDDASRDLSTAEIEAKIAAEAAGRRVNAEPMPTPQELETELLGTRHLPSTTSSPAAAAVEDVVAPAEGGVADDEVVAAAVVDEAVVDEPVVDGAVVDDDADVVAAVAGEAVDHLDDGADDAAAGTEGDAALDRVDEPRVVSLTLVPQLGSEPGEQESADAADEVANEVADSVVADDAVEVVEVVEIVAVAEAAHVVDVVDGVDGVDRADADDVARAVAGTDAVDVSSEQAVDDVVPEESTDELTVDVDDSDDADDAAPDLVAVIEESDAHDEHDAVTPGELDARVEPEVIPEVISDTATDEPADDVAEPVASADVDDDPRPGDQRDTHADEDVHPHEDSHGHDDGPGPRRPKVDIDNLFARLRAEREAAANQARATLADEESAPENAAGTVLTLERGRARRAANDTDAASVQDRPAAHAADAATDTTETVRIIDLIAAEEAHLAASSIDEDDLDLLGDPAGAGLTSLAAVHHDTDEHRDFVVGPLQTQLTRVLKRHLQDEQSAALAAVRTSRKRAELDGLLGDELAQRSRLASAITPVVADAARAGADRSGTALLAPERAVASLVDGVVDAIVPTLRADVRREVERVAAPESDASQLVDLVSGCYRRWTTERLSDATAGVLLGAYTVGRSG